MISYSPFWETLKKKNLTVYYLTVKKGVNSNTINCIKKGKSVTLYTINNLCEILDCRIEDIVEYIPDTIPASATDTGNPPATSLHTASNNP